MKKNGNSNANSHISRRTFINVAGAGTAIIVMGPVAKIFAGDLNQAVPWPTYASKYRFHMIGNAQIRFFSRS